MTAYRKKPVVIEATQWFKDGDHPAVKPHLDGYGWVSTLEGGHIVTPGDWIITGVQGEFYPCKPGIFEMTYETAPVNANMSTAGLDFSAALRAARDGARIARSGWNGKGMWVAMSGTSGPRAVAAGTLWSPHAHAFAEANGGVADVLPCLIMKTATNEILMGWLASQTDLLADDWMIMEDAA